MELYLVRKMERAAAALAIMRGVPSAALVDRAAQLSDAVHGEYT
jgi:hypothetical protein